MADLDGALMKTAIQLSPTKGLLVAALLISGCFVPEQTTNASSDTDGSTTSDSPGMTATPTGSGDTTTTAPPSTSGTTDDPDPTEGSTTGGATGSETDEGTTTGGPSGDSSSSGSDESSSTGEPVMCGDGGVCIAAIPEGWSGPVATRTIDINDDIPPCGGDSYTDLQVSDAFDGLSAADYECGCSCDAATLDCVGEAQIQISEYPPMEGFSPCTTPTYEYNETVASGAPQSVTIEMDEVRGIVLADEPTPTISGSCTPNPTVSPTPAGFETRTIACGTFDAVAEGCGGDGLCVPQPAAPYDAGVCIWAEGDLECPAGFDDRSVFYSEYTDTRDCSTCSCGGPVGDCEGQSIQVRGWCDDDNITCFPGTPGCGPGGSIACEEDVEYTIADLSFCEVIDEEDYCTPLCMEPASCLNCQLFHTLRELRDLTYDAGSADASCAPSGGSAVGEVAGSAPTTFCCS